ncbi:MAG TPA: sugar phosphate nucleotidyltransferase [Nakamurella sp.]
MPYLEHLLSRIREAGMRHVVLGTSYRAETFEEYFGDGTDLGLEIEYVVEDEPLGTVGRSATSTTGSDTTRRWSSTAMCCPAWTCGPS